MQENWLILRMVSYGIHVAVDIRDSQTPRGLLHVRWVSPVDWDDQLFLDPTKIKTLVEISMLRTYERWAIPVRTYPTSCSIRLM